MFEPDKIFNFIGQFRIIKTTNKLSKMLYNKNKEDEKQKRSYSHLHIHTSSEQVHRLQKKGRVMLNGKPKN